MQILHYSYFISHYTVGN